MRSTEAHPAELADLNEGTAGDRPAMTPNPRISARVAFWIVGFFLLCVIYFPGALGDWYQEARVDLSLSVVDHATISINAYQQNTGDKSLYRHNYYAIVAPGQSFVGVPIAAAYQAAAGSRGLRSAGRKYTYPFFVVKYLQTLYTVMAPGALLLLLFFWFLGYFTRSIYNRALLTMGLGLATSIFAYSQVLYAHVPAAMLAFASFILLYVIVHKAEPRGPRSSQLAAHPRATILLSALALGLAALFEYQVAIIGVLIGLYVLLRVQRRLWWFFLAGVLPGLAAILLYNYAAYHDPWTTGYSGMSYTYGARYGHGIAGFSWPPSIHALWGNSFSPYRGLFFLSPLLLLAFPGYFLWARRQDRDWLLFLAVPVMFFIAMAMYPVWSAGDSVGPRLLIPMLPFLTVPIIFVLDAVRGRRSRFLVYGLIALSIFNVWIETLGAAGYPRDSFINPLFQYSLPALMHDQLRASFGSVVLLPFGQIHSLWTLLPLAFMLAGWSTYCYRRARVRAARWVVPAAAE